MSAPTIPTDDVALFRQAVETLQEFHSKKLLANNFGVAIAALMHRDAGRRGETSPPVKIHHQGSGEPVSTNDFQTKICDPVFERDASFLPDGSAGPIYKPFTKSFKAYSSSDHNNWRNSFDLQGGLGCDAPNTADFLLDSTYLEQPRFHCQYRDPTNGTCRSPEGHTAAHRTCFNPNKKPPVPGPHTQAQHRPKLFKRGTGSAGGSGFWIIEPTEGVLTDLVGEPTQRIPAYPFICALYSGCKYLLEFDANANEERLQNDLQLNDSSFFTLFDLAVDTPYNKAFLDAVSEKSPSASAKPPPIGLSSTTATTGTTATASLSEPQPRTPRNPKTLRSAAGATADPARRALLLERATRAHEQTVQAVADQLTACGFSPTEQLDGFDLYAGTSDKGFLFEIKTWTAGNFRGQIRTGIAQLLEYRWRNKKLFPDEVHKYLVFDRRPSEAPTSWIWEFLTEDQIIIPCWIEENTVRTYSKLYSHIKPFTP